MSAAPEPAKLYDFKHAPNPPRVREFLAEKGITLPLETVDLDQRAHRAPRFLRINALGQVPVLERGDGTQITESIAICRYLEALHPAPALFGHDPRAQTAIGMWNRRIEFELLRTIGDVADHTDPLFADRIEQNAGYAAAQRRAAGDKWRWLDGEMGDGRPFIAGPAFSIADLSAMAGSWLGEQLGIAIPADLRRVRSWDGRMRERASWRA